MSEWYYNKGDDIVMGPVSENELLGTLRKEAIGRKAVLVWCEGMNEWVSAEDHFKGKLPPVLPHIAAKSPGIAVGVLGQHPPPLPRTPTNSEAKQVSQSDPPTLARHPFPATDVGKTDAASWLCFCIASTALLLFAGYNLWGAFQTVPVFQNYRVVDWEIKVDHHKLEFTRWVFLAGLLAFITTAVYFVRIIAKAWRILPQLKSAPAKKVAPAAQLLIPLWGWYWMYRAFGSWATQWSRVRSAFPELEDAPKVSSQSFKLCCSVAAFLSTAVIWETILISVPFGFIRDWPSIFTHRAFGQLVLLNLIWPAVGLLGQLALAPAVFKMGATVNFCRRLARSQLRQAMEQSRERNHAVESEKARQSFAQQPKRAAAHYKGPPGRPLPAAKNVAKRET